MKTAIQMALVFGACLAGLAAGGEPRVKKVLFIGIDGTRTDALLAAEAPRLKALREGGAFFTNVQIFKPDFHENDTVSGPGWSNLLTGVWPDKHGVMDNTFKNSHLADYPHFFVRLKELRPALVTASIEGWEPLHSKLVRGADKSILTAVKGKPWPQVDKDAVKEAIALLSEKEPDVLFVYISNVDETGHANRFHPQDPAYSHAIAEADVRVGELLDGAKARPNYAREDWLIVVATDHGGEANNHGHGHENDNVRKVWFILSGEGVKPAVHEEAAYQVDLVATIFKHLGLEPKAEWKLDGKVIGLKN